MYITEDEAKTKWCPMARMASGNRSCNRYDVEHLPLPRGSFCIASACMMWCSKKSDPEQRILPVGEEPEPDAKSKGWETPTTTTFGRVVWERSRPAKGFCGLAVKL